MNSARVIIGLLIAARLACADTAPWHVPSAPWRVKLETNSPTSWPAEAGAAAVWPSGADAAGFQATVFADNGTPVGCHILAAVEGDPVRLFFDTSSGAKTYYVYPAAPTSPPAWNPQAGLILATKPRPPGPATNVNEIQRLWDSATNVTGRSVVPQVYYGTQPDGPPTNFLADFQGWFMAPQAGEYRFTTVSYGPSILRVDGRNVSVWPDWHNPDFGRRGEHSGRTPLGAGRHSLEYLHVQGDGAMCMQVAWLPPGKQYFEVMPASAFVPVAHFHVSEAQWAPGAAPGAYFGWTIMEHNTIDGLAVVNVLFDSFEPDTNTVCRWTFDDGTATNDASVIHVFPRPGLRTVKLDIQRKGGPAVSASRRISVHPLWWQIAEWEDARWERQKASLAGRDLAAMPTADLLHLTTLAERIDELDWLVKLGAALFNRRSELNPDDARLFLRLALQYQHPAVREYGMAERAFDVALGLNPPDRGLLDRIRLHCAGFLIRSGGRIDAAAPLLNATADENLTDQERRMKKIYLADLLFYGGRTKEAREAYEAIGSTVNAKAPFTIQALARISMAREYLQRGEYDGAADILYQLRWETPALNMSPEIELPMIQALMNRREYPFALTLCHALLNVELGERDRSELLCTLTELDYTTGRTKDAELSLAALLKDHPYSEAAARARDKWGTPSGAAAGAK